MSSTNSKNKKNLNKETKNTIRKSCNSPDSEDNDNLNFILDGKQIPDIPPSPTSSIEKDLDAHE